MIEKLISTIRKRHRFSEEEEQLLRSKMTEFADFAPRDIIVPEDTRVTYSSLLAEGIACRSKTTADGARQIMEFQIPGDFVDLHSYPLEKLDHSISAMSACRIVKLQHTDVSELIEKHPRFARIFWFMTMVDASIHREWLVNLGSRTGVARIAHLFCEMFYRLRVVGMTDGNSYHFPVSQADLAEATGFTSIHMNRLLRELRERELATFRSKTVQIHDLQGLEEVAGFDPAYLFLEPRRG